VANLSTRRVQFHDGIVVDSVDVHLDWTPGSGRIALADAVRRRSGTAGAAGAVVPSTRALAHDLGVARGTVTRVYADLAAEGYLRTSQGAPPRCHGRRGRVVLPRPGVRA